ncbi:MAG: ATP-binding protein [Pseudomonadota bacterium]
MRVRGSAGSPPHVVEDKSRCFMLSRLLLYMDRLLDKYHSLDFEILEALHWLLGPEIVQEDLIPLISMLDGGDKRRRFEADLRDEIRHGRDFAPLVDQALRQTHKDEQMCVVGLLRGLIKKRLDHLQYRRKSDIEKSLGVFQQMFDLNDLEREICLFLFILSTYEEAQSLFEYHLKCDRFAGRNYLATILGSKVSEIADALNGKLFKIGILDSDRHRSLSIDTGFVHLLQNTSDSDIKTEFFRKIDPDPVPLDAHTVDPQAIEHMINLLRAKPSSSTHIILYGPPGSGKTSMAYGLGKKLGLPIYVVEHGGKEKGWKRQAAFTACVNMASQGEGALVIADDSDNILGTRNSWFFSGETSDKRWLHDILETPGVRMIWTVNSIANLGASVARRFSFSLCFKPFSRVQRKRVWETILTDYRLDSFFDTADVDHLARRFEVSAGVIEQSVRKAEEMGSDSKAEVLKALILSLEAHDSLVNGGRKPLSAGKIDPEGFTLDGLNVSGANLGSLMKELETFNDYLKHPSNDEPVSMSLLFHGVSGAGKSHMARYIAHHLDREILVKRASDLLSPWVGETEHNIRDAFDEAAEKEALLVFDESDFLLGNRDRAAHSWEISQVNEFLTAMECYRGIQIYTSNRFTDIDSATLRRFNHKIEFHCLKPEGILVFYKKIVQPLVGSELEKKLENELKNIQGLTPGDFKVVLTQFRFKAPGERSHESMIAALHEESKVKEIHAGKKAIGF